MKFCFRYTDLRLECTLDEQRQLATDLVVKLICNARNIAPELVSGSAHLVDDLGFDSLDATQLMAALHAQTGRELDVSSLADLSTVDSVVTALLNEGKDR
jgi:acyl carrier protein